MLYQDNDQHPMDRNEKMCSRNLIHICVCQNMRAQSPKQYPRAKTNAQHILAVRIIIMFNNLKSPVHVRNFIHSVHLQQYHFERKHLCLYLEMTWQ